MLGWLRNAAVTLTSRVLQAGGSLRENWGVGVLSIVLAVALWVFVTDKANPDVTGAVPGNIAVKAVNVPEDQAVFSLSPETVRVSVQAPDSIFGNLEAADFTASIDLAGVTSQQAIVPVRVETSKGRVDVLEISPLQVTVRLENVTSRTVPVESNLVGPPPPGFEARTITVQPEETVVTGPESLVAKVATVEADVNLTGLRTNFQATLLLTARDDRGGDIQGVNIAPESAAVNVEIAQLDFSRVFVVQADVSGTPATGFVVAGLEVDPAFVTVSGPAEVFQGLDPSAGVSTETISIDGASADVVRPVALTLPAGARVAQANITVRVIIRPLASLTPTSSGP
jgi:YbbR domain-containing protein